MAVIGSSGGATAPGRLERVAFGLGIDGRWLRAPGNRPAAVAPDDPGQSPGDEPRVAPRERRDWAYLGLLAFTVTLFLRPQDVYPPLGALHLAELCAIVGLGALITGRLARHHPVLPLNREVRGIILFAGIMLAVVPFSTWPGGSLSMLLELYLKVVLIFILMAGTLTTAARLHRFVWLIVLASGYLGLIGVLDYGRGINMVEDGRLAGSVGGVFNNPNDLAMNMVSFLPAAVLLAARRSRPVGRSAAAIASVLMFVTVIFTKSRGGFIGLIAMLLVLLAQGGKIRRGFAAGALVAVLASVPLLPTTFWARMGSITDESEDVTGSAEARRTVMRMAWDAFVEHPVTGVGPGEFKDYNPQWRVERWREAHNAYLQVASESGIVGAVVFVALVVMAVRDAWGVSRRLSRKPGKSPATPTRGTADAAGAAVRRAQPERDAEAIVHLYATATSASIVGWIVCAMFASVAYTWTFYYVFGIAMACRQIAQTSPGLANRFTPAASRRMAAA